MIKITMAAFLVSVATTTMAAEHQGIFAPSPPGSPTCAAAEFRTGEPLDQALVRRLPKVRVVRPGEAVTKDFRPDRVTVYVDKTGRVIRAECG